MKDFSFLSFYDELDLNEKLLLENFAVKRTFLKGELIRGGSDKCFGLVLVKSGQLRAFINSQNGKELTLYRLTDDDVCLFSASCKLQNLDFDIDITAEKDTTCLVIAPDIFEKLTKNIAFERFINMLMSKRFSDVVWLIEQTVFKSFDARLAAFLIEQSAFENSYKLSLTHEEIARHLGSAREVVSRMLKHFQGEGYVKSERGKIELLDIDALFLLAKK